MLRLPLPLLVALLCACSPKPAAVGDAPAADASAPTPAAAPPPAPTPDPELQRAASLHEPCSAAASGVQRADAATAPAAGSAPGLFRLGEWLRFFSANCPGPAPSAKRARDAAEAFEKAHRLDPTRREYVLAWAFERPDSAAAAKAVDDLLARDPQDPVARLWKARRPGLSEEESLALLQVGTGRCAQGGALLLGDLLLKEGQARPALEAYLREIHGACEPVATQWQGEEIARRAAARLGAARAALALGDGLEARRQLRWLDFDAIDAALATVDPTVEEALWERTLGLDRGAARPAPRPEEVVPALEAALLRGDARAASALLADPAAGTEGCEQYASDRSGPHATFPMCLHSRLLPEAPVVERCDEVRDGRAVCLVKGRGGEAWRVRLAGPQKGWRLAESTRR